MRTLAVALCLLLTAPAVAGAVAETPARSAPTARSGSPALSAPTVQPAANQSQSGQASGRTGPRIRGAYPDPVAHGDAGEFVVLDLPDGGTYTLTDGDANVTVSPALANATSEPAGPNATTRIAVGDAAAANNTDLPLIVADLSLANGGERLRLRRGGRHVDSAIYRDTEEGSVVRWPTNGSAGVRWTPLGATDFAPVVARGGRVRAFVLPDAPGVPLDVLWSADRRLLLAGYTITSERVADALVAAHRRNVTVRVLVEGDPVGGRTRREARLLDRLVRAGVEVRALGGPHARYRYHHAKYAVVDDRAVVMTENWKPAGTGGNSSRGWGVVTTQSAVVAGLSETFRADAGWRGARPWTQFRRGRTFQRGERATGGYPQSFAPATVPVERTRLLVVPDSAGEVVDRLDGANDSIDAIQVTTAWDAPQARALRRAARRGVRVRLLLSGAWYVREDNRRLRDRFREWARANDAPLQVRLADPGSRYGKIHAKGAVVDDRTVLLGSLNWNGQATRRNREIVLELTGERVAGYYGRVFDADWRGGRGLLARLRAGLPLGLLAAVLGVAVVAVAAARRLQFEARG